LERIAVAARHNGATAAPLLRCHSGGQEVVRLISRRLGVREPTFRHELGKELELIHQLVVELTAALVGREQLLPECGSAERIPADEHSPRRFGLVKPQQEVRETDDRTGAAATGPPDALRKTMVGAVGERVTVNHKQGLLQVRCLL
jgi:hypothetical protein